MLSLDVDDFELGNRRAVVRNEGGDFELLHFQTGSARLLPRLIAGRPGGPLFLTDRRPAPGRAPAIVDVCPVTGRARLSYRRAEEIFRDASGGWTLHQLRHSAITHLAEGNDAYRRRIGVYVNRHEGRHSVGRVIFHGNRGQLRQPYRQGQEDQLSALGLALNILVLWNTQYMDDAVNQLRATGREINDDDLVRLSPLQHEHIKMLGTFHFALPDELTAGQRRTLRTGDDRRA